jgi:hypothetical protein
VKQKKFKTTKGTLSLQRSHENVETLVQTLHWLIMAPTGLHFSLTIIRNQEVANVNQNTYLANQMVLTCRNKFD